MKFICVLLFCSFLGMAQDYPQNYFISPLDIPLDFSGSFGELRTNHFHAGLDLKTNGKTGLAVYAVADGYVSRIKISTYGYGKAIYITHPNGYTTVYGHLEKANGLIEEVINKKHYEEKSFEIEIFFKQDELQVKQGEIIAFSGNSGGSGGPHLHFEIRDSKTENILNPLLFGFDKMIADIYKPKVLSLMVYPLNDSIVVNDVFIPQVISLSSDSEGNYIGQKVFTNGAIGFGINVFDNMTNAYNKNGIYKVSTFVNGVPYFSYKFDTFSFDESKHINYFMDYYRFKKQRQRFQKLFNFNDYPLSIVNKNKRDGILKVQPGASYNYKIVLEDFFKNTTVIEVPVVYKKNDFAKNTSSKKGLKIKAKNEYNFEKDHFTVYFPEHTFYEDFYINIEVENEMLLLHEDEVPVGNYFTIYAEVSGVEESLKSKSFIAYIDGKDISYNKTYLKGDKLSARVKKLGNYKVIQDTIPPNIYAVNFSEGKIIDSYKTISIKISDDLSGIDSYKAYLNGNWILMDYDYKTNRLVHNLSDGIYVSGKNDFKLVVGDEMNNSAIFESFFYKNN